SASTITVTGYPPPTTPWTAGNVTITAKDAYGTTAVGSPAVPRPDHVVIVVEENHSYGEIIGNTAQAPYLNSLSQGGATFTNSSAIAHPSGPNYLALFSGSTQGVIDDGDYSFNAPNLAGSLSALG